MNAQESARIDEPKDQRLAPPAVSLPKGGGAIKGIGEKFAANPVTGTGSLTIPLPLSPGRSGFTPALGLSYDSGAGNGPYGFGWTVGYPNVSRRTDRGLPQYLDNQESDVFILSGAEDLVPVVRPDGTRFEEERNGYRVTRYRPRIEGLFARIERWRNLNDPSDAYWRSISRDNVTTFYGKTAQSRIADPADPTRIFTWLISESFDDKGAAAVYEYVAEDGRNVDKSLASEYNRSETSRSANRHLKRVKYANRASMLAQPDLAEMEWLFELVMDYGDHEGESPSVAPTTNWPVRPDPFSTNRAGFEVRTYRRCQRILMFHRFEELGPEPRLVRSLDLDYDDFAYPQGFDTRAELEHPGSTRIGSLLRRATLVGYGENGFRKTMPPLELAYSRPQISEETRALDEESLANLPSGVDGVRHQWLDLNSEGISGILAEQGGAWWYKPNLGEGRLGPQELVALKPSAEIVARVQFLDLAGDGPLDLVQLDRPNAGFFERNDQNGWSPFTPFASQPNIEWDDPNLRFVDLTGDGHADVLITEDGIISWHPSLGEEGFGPRESLKMAVDESLGPKLVFHDTTETIFLADMTGDGLSDLARIRNGEVCYWPNLGYGRFGGKVTMDDAPVFDAPDLFDPRRIRLADIDGSGVVDIVYLAGAGVRLYFNRSGASWSAPYKLASFPPIDNVASVSVTDLLGNGTACLVWSSPLPNEARAPLRYVDLMGGQKPHLLIGVENNLGAETRIQYASSTRYYLEDRLAGRPWITRLPFPVHVVERTETYDRISRNRFVTHFAYHHGYFDGVEREFRGFGMVEQWDTEEFAALNSDQRLSPDTNTDASSHVPPVLTRTWFHTGVYLDRDRVSNFFGGLLDDKDTGEYYREPGLNDEQARRLLLDDTVIPPGLNVDEEREACRALKGAILRQEVYALDGTDKQPHPYSVTEQNFTIRLLQPQGENPHAVFFSHPREAISYHYERVPTDPRVAHSLTLEVDDFGNVLKSAAVAYGRRQSDPALEARDQIRQGELHIIYMESRVTNHVEAADEYRAPLPCESRGYELTGLALGTGRVRFTLEELLNAGLAAAIIAYEQSPSPGALQKRLIEHTRTLYRNNDLGAALPLGQLESRALPFESYKLAFTPGLLAGIYGAKVTDSMLANDGRYVHSEGDNQWWIPSGRVFHSPGADDDLAAELAHAQQHFFLSRRYRDPFGQTTFVTYDVYDLLITEIRDALGNLTTIGARDASGALVTPGIDYRVLQPRLITDANGNRAAANFDAMGMVVGTAIMGKRDETPRQGDLLEGFVPDLGEDVVASHLTNPLADPHAILHRATTRLVYDLFAYYRTKERPQPSPNVVYAIVRETHDADLAPGKQTKIQHSFSYSDGFGREIQKKIQAEPGPAPRRDPVTGRIIIVDGEPEFTEQDVSPRWVGSGWMVFNNKGEPVRQFEPFFTDTHGFEFEVRIGVSPILFYDPVGRVVGALHPNHTWEKVVFNPWRQETWDVNDTSLIPDPRTDAEVGDFFRRLDDAEYMPTWYAQRQAGALGPQEQAAAARTAIHAGTPSVAHADSLGRAFLTVAHNRFKRSDPHPSDPPTEEFYSTRVILDIEGNQREVVDPKDRVVMRYDYDMLGNRIHQASMEAGERWALADVAGKPVYAWDSRGHRFRTAYDALQRPAETFLREGARPEVLIERTVYGESQANPEVKNQRGKAVRLFDQAGVVTSEDYDFKGNLLASRRQLAREYKATLDWSLDTTLEGEVYTGSTRFDALNRPISITTPDNSVYRPTFNESNLLEKVDVNLRGAPAATPFVTDIDYNAKGQRVFIEYGPNVKTNYEYDRVSFRLTRLQTLRGSERLQNLSYTYDPGGNITHIEDSAQQTIYYSNQVVTPSNDYTYDAIYRLITAEGREHIGQAAQPQTTWDDRFRAGLPHPNDGQAMRRYNERYEYDAVGNFLQLIHRAMNGDWTRGFEYNEPSLIEPGKNSNRLSGATVGANNPTTETYAHDAHGNMIAMPHLPLMQWDFKDQLQASSRQVVNEGAPETTYYVYDGAGQRVRKVTERQNGGRKNERVYLGAFEVYREYAGDGSSLTLERETMHVMDDEQRIALVETRTQGNDLSPGQLIRYQFGNHLGSASLELDDSGQIISYEEYHPYGSTSYQAVGNQTEMPKRYRYTGMERDEETGFTYHGARYYVAWLGSWVSCDPIGLSDSLDLYLYARGNPIAFTDPDGLSPTGNSGPVKSGYTGFWAGVKRLWRKTAIIRSLWKGMTQLDDANVPWKYVPDEPSKPGIHSGSTGGGRSPGPDPPDIPPKGKRGSSSQPDHITEQRMAGSKKTGPHSKGGGAGGAAAGKAELHLGSSSAKSGSRSARIGRGIGSFAFAAAMPDPSDALMLIYEYFAAYGEARESIAQERWQAGFSYGLAASLLEKSGRWVKDEIAPWGTTANVATLILDAEGIAERSFIKALKEGMNFGRSLTEEERHAFLQTGFDALAAEGYELVYRDAFDVEVKRDATDVVYNLGRALQPTINKALEEIREREERLHQAELKQQEGNIETWYAPVPPMYGQSGSSRMR
jgi:RHS repeat-associated protein